MKKIIFITLAFIFAFFNLNAQENETIHSLKSETFKDSITLKKVQLIDVRTPEEYKSGHIEYADNIDFFSVEFNDEFNKLDKEQPIYIYCKSGNRSGQSATKLSEMGFKIIYDLQGGILNYN